MWFVRFEKLTRLIPFPESRERQSLLTAEAEIQFLLTVPVGLPNHSENYDGNTSDLSSIRKSLSSSIVSS